MAEPPVVPPIEPPPPPETSRPLHTLPAPFSHEALEVITQGAEALVYKTTFLTPNTPVVVKYRPPKPYRHPTLDKRLTKQRLLAEARSLIRVKRGGVNVPGVIGADWDAGWLVLEYVDGRTVRKVLDGWAHQVTQREKDEKATEDVSRGHSAAVREGEDEILDLMRRVGREVGKLHELGVCHGDLTTSNIMLRTPKSQNTEVEEQQQMSQRRQTTSSLREAAMRGEEPPDLPPANPPQQSHPTSLLAGDIFLIDFGLTTASIQDEDKAVDLYVLERAFSATHPAAEPLFQEVLKAYGECGKGARGVLKRLEGVRLRGRKRSMLG
jgi:TP53 regulating kinase-like protein